MLSENDIARLVERIRADCAPLVVGTFGSYAVGSADDSSDLDLFVVRDTPETRQARRVAVLQLLDDVLHPVDVHVFTPREFEDTVGEYLSFTWVIARQARLYHWS